MPIKCYYNQCPRHDNEGPLCYEGRCRASPDDLKKYELERKLKAQGYDLDELDMDNPYNGWVYEG